MLNFTINLPTRILFGNGVLEELSTTDLLPKGDKAMIVITKGGTMLRRGYLARVQGYLGAKGVKTVVYDKVSPNPEADQIHEAVAIAKDMGVEFLVGLGGGSAMDAAKAIAVGAANPGLFWDYMPAGSGKRLPLENPALPIVAIPTTAGTGSETAPGMVISKPDTKEKTALRDQSCFPALAVVDPELTLSMPPRLTALTALDAMFHAIEGYLSLKRQPLTDMLALEAVHLISHTLPEAMEDPDDLKSRTILSWAAVAAGMVLAMSGTTSQHSLEHALSAYNPDLPHGLGLALLSRAYFAHVMKTAPERFDDLALAMGVEDVDELPEAERPQAFLAALDGLLNAVGLGKETLADWGFTPDMAEDIVDNAYERMGSLFDNTPGEPTREGTIALVRAAMA